MAQEIVALKLSSSEEVLGKLVKENEEQVVLDTVLGLLAQPGPDGGVRIGLVPFMMSNPDADHVVFERYNIVCRTSPSKALLDGYLQQISSIDLTSKLPGK